MMLHQIVSEPKGHVSYFSYIMVVRFIDGGNRSTRGKPPICRKSLTNFITYMFYTSAWSRFKLTTSVVIVTDCIGSYKSKSRQRQPCQKLCLT